MHVKISHRFFYTDDWWYTIHKRPSHFFFRTPNIDTLCVQLNLCPDFPFLFVRLFIFFLVLISCFLAAQIGQAPTTLAMTKHILSVFQTIIVEKELKLE